MFGIKSTGTLDLVKLAKMVKILGGNCRLIHFEEHKPYRKPRRIIDG